MVHAGTRWLKRTELSEEIIKERNILERKLKDEILKVKKLDETVNNKITMKRKK